MPQTNTPDTTTANEKVYHFIHEITGIDIKYTWILEVFLVVFAVVLTNFILKRVFNRLQKKADKSQNVWDDAIVAAIRSPARGVIWVMGLTFAAEIAFLSQEATANSEEIFHFLSQLRQIGFISLLAWFLIRIIGQLEHTFKNHNVRRDPEAEPVDETTVDAIGRLFRMTVYITASLVMMQTLGFSISGILAFGGIGGFAVGFAAKDLLSNVFGGLSIFMDRPFSVGDWIRSPDRTIEGTVEQIGWRRTVIRKFDKRPLYVPNATFLSIAVENPSRMTNRRIYETIGIRYCDADAMTQIVDAVKYYLRNNPDIDQDQTMIVNFNVFGPHSLDFFVYTFTKTTVWVDFHEIKHEIMLEIYKIIRDHGADCAFPTTTLDIPDNVDTPALITSGKNAD